MTDMERREILAFRQAAAALPLRLRQLALSLSLEEQGRAEKKAALGADKDVAQFEVLFNQGQELAQKMKGYLLKARGRENGEVAQGMEKAMLALSDLIRGCAE